MNQEINPNSTVFLLSQILTEIKTVKEDIADLKSQEKKIYQVEKEVATLQNDVNKIKTGVEELKVEFKESQLPWHTRLQGWASGGSLVLSLITIITLTNLLPPQ